MDSEEVGIVGDSGERVLINFLCRFFHKTTVGSI